MGIINRLVVTIMAAAFLLNPYFITGAIAQEEKPKQETTQEEKAPGEHELETMTVTAPGKREENIQEVAASISALSDIQIEDAGIVSIHDMAFQMPNFNIVNNGWRHASTMIIRGIGVVDMLSSAAGFYVDDVSYSAGMAFDTELFDIERIEVLRGPQGTLYGRNTMGGIVNIITKKPGNLWEGKASVGYGGYDSQDYRAAIRGPLVKDKLFFGLSGVKAKRDGFGDNTYLGTEPDDRDGLSGRGIVRWLPTDALDITLSMNAERIRDGIPPMAPIEKVRSDPGKVTYDYDGYNNMDSNGQSLRVVYDTPWFKLTSITARRDFDYDSDGDSDFSPANMVVYNCKFYQDQWTQELRLQSLEDSGAMKWLVGAYYLKEDLDSDILGKFPEGYPAWGLPPFKDQQLNFMDTEGYAFFGQATYTLFEKLGLTAGLRYDRDKKEIDWRQSYDQDLSMWGMIPSTLKADDEWDEWSPKVAIDYRWTPSLMSYISAAKGYRSGGFNYMTKDPAYISYDPEYSWNYELGLKSSWLDNRLMLNLAAFYIDWQDQQIRVSHSLAEQIFKNAGESHSQGFEVEMVARPVRGLELTAGVGYTDAKFDDYKDPIYDPMTGLKIGEEIHDDNRIPYVPKYTCNVAAQYRHASGVFGRIEMQRFDDFYHDAGNTQKEDAYQLVNARLGYEWEHFDIYLWAKNVFDEEYVTYMADMGGGDWYGFPSDPRTFGVMLTGRF